MNEEQARQALLDLGVGLPRVGSIWDWEPMNPMARALVRVTDVTWNGDEWWVTTERVAQTGDPHDPRRHPNEWGRFIEACILVTPAPGDE